MPIIRDPGFALVVDVQPRRRADRNGLVETGDDEECVSEAGHVDQEREMKRASDVAVGECLLEASAATASWTATQPALEASTSPVIRAVGDA